MEYMMKNGYRHHTAVVPGKWAEAVEEAFNNYLGYNCDII